MVATTRIAAIKSFFIFAMPGVEADFFGFDDSVLSTAKQNLT
jgi:hypothetical protein